MDFKSNYSRKEYISFFKNHLLSEDFEEHEEEVPVGFQTQFIQNVNKIGEVRSLELGIYEIEHQSENDPRVSLSRDTFRLLAQYNTKQALIIFTSKKSANFRLSLVTIDLKWEQGKRVQKEYSNPRRYSFFLGPDSKTHTPEEYLIKKGRVKDFDDLQKRFSIEIVNKEFYTAIAVLFTKLAGGKREIGRKSIDAGIGCLKLPSTSDDTKRKEFVVRLIGRLVFCWFLKKKKSNKDIPLLPEDLLSSQAIQENKDYYHNVLEPLFFEVLNTPVDDRSEKYKENPWNTIPFLNGGLFTPHHNDFYDLGTLGISKHINNLKVPDEWIKELFEVFETYNFTIDENTSIDVELSIEPEMLGRIFENLLAEINPETGETARKSTGSYYTPRPIVEYMVDESLKQYLLTKTNLSEDKISSLLSYEDIETKLTDNEKSAIIDALDTIKIIDPACGSGAFPMGILQKIFLILQKIDPKSQQWLNKILAKTGDTLLKRDLISKLKADNFNYIHKLGIVRDAIYGVDIQPIAVEISKLRFFLSLVVDEKVDDSKENRGIEPLPNLEFKFVCANSLIGLPKLKLEQASIGSIFKFKDGKTIENMIEELEDLRDEYFECPVDNKKKIEERFKAIQKEISYYVINSAGKDTMTVKLANWEPFSDEPCSWFDPEWMFGIRTSSLLEKGGQGGFDIVIANPPYVRQEDIKEQKPLFQKQGYEVYNSTSDLYTYFYERSWQILREKGVSCFISSNKWMRAKYGEKLRKFFKEKTKLLQIIDFNGYKVFDATVDTNIILFQKAFDNNKHKITITNIKNDFVKDNNMQTYMLKNSFNFMQKTLNINCYTFENIDLKEKIEKAGIPLKDWDVKIYRGITTGLNEAFIIDTPTKERLCSEDPKSAEILKPILRGRDISRYCYKWAGLWIIFIPWHFPLHKDLSIQGASKKAEIELKKQYPAIYNHLLQFKDSLLKRNREETGIRYEWYALQRCAATYYPEFEKEKIFVSEFGYYFCGVFDSTKKYCLDTVHIILGSKYHLAILNSNIISKYIKTIATGLGEKGIRFKPQFIEKLPIPKISEAEQKPFVELVDHILTVTKDDDYLQNSVKQANVKEYERQIDQMVYKLYGLTDDEIKIIKGK